MTTTTMRLEATDGNGRIRVEQICEGCGWRSGDLKLPILDECPSCEDLPDRADEGTYMIVRFDRVACRTCGHADVVSPAAECLDCWGTGYVLA